MLLKLEVVGAQANRLGEQRSKVFAAEGGTIGRVPGNDWVLPDQFVSSRHASIQYADGQFYVIDTNSSNGVCLNAPNFRLEQGRPYPLNTGDRLLIDPFDIHVSVIESAAAQEESSPEPTHETLNVSRPAPSAPSITPAAASDPFAVEEEVPFIGTLPAPNRRTPGQEESIVPMGSDQAEDPVDPLDALGFRKVAKGPPPPRVEDLARGSPLRSNFELPRITPRPPPPEERPTVPPMQPVPPAIPADYNPLAHTDFERSVARPPPPAPPPAPPAAPRRPAPAPAVRADLRRPAAQPLPPRREAPTPRSTPRQPLPQRPVSPAPIAKSSSPPPPQSSRPPPPASPPRASTPAASPPAVGRAQLDFAALLAAAGIQGVPATPDLSASFGSILKVVVDGLRDVLRAREELKDQFRLRITSVGPRENNPIKFSANTEDALHNLLVRHNPAYLEPVAAFESAFDDLRIHQMAMLAGLRAGYEAMVKAFDPDTLEQKFERYARRGGLLGASAKPRFWDLYREVFEETTGDPDECFRTLFGSAFSKAYEEQTRLLKQRSRSQ